MVWTAPAGKDALTSSDSELSFLMSANYEQIALLGLASAGVSVVFNFASPPHVLLPGYEGGIGYRPFPQVGVVGTSGWADVSTTGFTMTYDGAYVVFKKSF